MPRRELKNGQQVASWLEQVSQSISQPAEIILIHAEWAKGIGLLEGT